MKIRKLFAGIMTAAVVLGTMSTSVLADPPPTGGQGGNYANHAVQEYDETVAPEAGITKSVATGKNTTGVPHLTYTFHVQFVPGQTIQDGAPPTEDPNNPGQNLLAKTYTSASVDHLSGVATKTDDPPNIYTIAPQITGTPNDKLTEEMADYSDTTDYYKKESKNFFEHYVEWVDENDHSKGKKQKTFTLTDQQKTDLNLNPDGVGILVYDVTEAWALDSTELAAWGGSRVGETNVYKTPETTTPGEYNETLTLSKAEYRMYVYIKEAREKKTITPTTGDPFEAWEGTGQYYIYAVTVQQTKYDDGEPSTQEKKKNPTLQGDPSVFGDFSDLEFVNRYEKVKVTDPIDPNGQGYEISKKVTGVDNDTALLTAADRPQFHFTVKATRPAGSATERIEGRLWDSTNGGSWHPLTGYGTPATEIDFRDSNNQVVPGYTAAQKQSVIYADFGDDDTATFQLKLRNDQKITFPSLPTGITFEVVEDDYYATPENFVQGTEKTWRLMPTVNGKALLDRTSIDGQLADPATEDAAKAALLAARTDTQITAEQEKASAYQNDGSSGTTPTGILMNYLPFFVIIALAIALLAAVVVFKGRRRAHGLR